MGQSKLGGVGLSLGQTTTAGSTAAGIGGLQGQAGAGLKLGQTSTSKCGVVLRGSGRGRASLFWEKMYYGLRRQDA